MKLISDRPSDPFLLNAWANEISSLLGETETTLIELLTRTIRANKGASSWQTLKLAQAARLHADLARLLDQDFQTILDTAEQILNDALQAGQGMARNHLKNLTTPTPIPLPAAIQLAIHQIAADTLTALTSIKPVVLREIADEYQEVMASPVTDLTLGIYERRAATQKALNTFASRGITGFTDRSGRRWSMDAYAEMATRAGIMNSYRAGYHTNLALNGQDLVIVSDHNYECDKCAPWENKIISLTGQTPTGTITLQHATNDNETVQVRVTGTLQEAEEQGLFHPNCGHTTALYIPGITRIFPARHDPATYKASQEQRAWEREIRKQKRLRAAALTKEAQKEPNKQIRKAQAAIRELIADHPEPSRRPSRERIKTAH